MAHVLILRQCPSFTQGEGLIQGTHEEIESNINKRKYDFNGFRKGYNIPAGSQWIPMDYRIKKECIPEFLRDLGTMNLNPETLPKHFWKTLFLPEWFCKKMKWAPWHWKIGKAKQLAIIFFKFLSPLKSYDAAVGPRNKFTDKWNYNIFIGVIPDSDRGFG